MQNIDLYVTMVVVLGAMVLFFFFVLKSVANQLANMSKNNLLRQNEMYDEIIQNKTNELSKIQQALNTSQNVGTRPEKQVQKQQAPQKPAPHFMSGATYVSGDVFQQYVKIKKHFNFDVSTSLKQLPLEQKTDSGRYESAKQLLERLTVDRVYALTTLSDIQQYNVLYESFSSLERQRLNEYKANEKKECFDIIGFVEWLKEIVFLENNQIIVRTNDEALVLPKAVGQNVVTQQDPDICEGFYVIHQGRLYDYAIKIKEMIQ